MPKALSWSDLDLRNVLGEGKAGVVRLAVLKRAFGSLVAGTPVAVKTFKPWVLEEPGQYERIIRELETGRTINHRNVIKTLSILRSPDGNPALVMKYYAGESLQSLLQRKRATGDQISLSDGFQIIGALAAGIAAVHKVGCIHRDIKPANIVLEESNPVIMDFGVVRSSALPEQTTTGTFLGTLRYSAPEYIFGEECDSSGDIYSFGAIVYEVFGDRVYLDGADHWAKVVVKKSEPGHSDAAPSFYRDLERRGGLNVAAFIHFILESSLCRRERRCLDLENLSEACKQRIWEAPFFNLAGKVVAGWTAEVFGWGSHAGLSVAQIAERVAHDFSAEERGWLFAMLKEHYWESDISILDSRDLIVSRLEYTPAIRTCVDSGDRWCSIHPAMRLAYRYGLLHPT